MVLESISTRLEELRRASLNPIALLFGAALQTPISLAEESRSGSVSLCVSQELNHLITQFLYFAVVMRKH